MIWNGYFSLLQIVELFNFAFLFVLLLINVIFTQNFKLKYNFPKEIGLEIRSHCVFDFECGMFKTGGERNFNDENWAI